MTSHGIGPRSVDFRHGSVRFRHGGRLCPPGGKDLLQRISTRRHSDPVAASPKHNSRRVIVVVVPPVDELDLIGSLQVFNSINRLAGRIIYTIEVVTSAADLTVQGEGGVLTFMARRRFDEVEGTADSVLLVCGLGSRSTRDAALSAWLRKTAGEVRRLGAVCVAAFLLAEAGLLKGRRATSHWRFGRELAARHPDVRV